MSATEQCAWPGCTGHETEQCAWPGCTGHETAPGEGYCDTHQEAYCDACEAVRKLAMITKAWQSKLRAGRLPVGITCGVDAARQALQVLALLPELPWPGELREREAP